MDTGNHDILSSGVAQIEHVIDHFSFVGFNDSVLMADINDRTEFSLCHGCVLRVRIHAQKKKYADRQAVDHEDHRRH